MIFPFSLLAGKARNHTVHPVVLLILDGYGVAPPSGGNAISRINPGWMKKLYKEYPYGELMASGESVGLPANSVGNSEVGHLTIGAGRIIFQSLKRINSAIEDRSFFDNRAFFQAIKHVKKHDSTLNLMGLVGPGDVHSSVNHLYALLELCKTNDVFNVNLHLFTDGRDAPPQEAEKIIAEIEAKCEELGVGKIVSISGRYYAMDRDRRWERTQKAYQAIAEGKGEYAINAIEAVKKAYARGETDEFILPTVIVDRDGGHPLGSIHDGDAVIFFNFRIDRPRQLTMAFCLPDFENIKSFKLGYEPDRDPAAVEEISGPTFSRGVWHKDIFFVTMTEYHKDLPVSAVAFPPEVIAPTLAEVLSKAKVNVLCLAESEKERMVTYYFNGQVEKSFENEDVKILPSKRIATYDKNPQMSLPEIVAEFKKQIDMDKYSFVIVNFANPDMVAHTGNLGATMAAIRHVNWGVGEVYKKVMEAGGTLIITADHGNAEELLNFPTSPFFVTSSSGAINTDHSVNPVPVVIAGAAYKGTNKETAIKGYLYDVAPTVLKMLKIEQPKEMTGKSLI